MLRSDEEVNPMRTLIIVVVLLFVAVAAGASFVVGGGAQQPGATLDYACDTTRIPANVDTLVRCRAVVTNTGQERLSDVRLQFEPAPGVPSPDRWYFFGARLDGAPFEVDRGQIVYDIGRAEPGERFTLDLDIILRVSAPSGAVVSLWLAPDGTRLTQQLVVIEPDEAPPSVTIDLQLEQSLEDPHLYVGALQFSSEEYTIDSFTADIALSPGLSIPDGLARTEPLLGEEVFGGKFHLRLVTLDPPATPPATVGVPVEVYAGDPCQGGSLALVGYVHAPDGPVARPSLVTELPVDPDCFGGDLPGGVTSLGQGGFAPEQQDVEAAVALIAMLAGILGFATVGLAIFVVR
jgi:hypothetical protein